MPNDMHEIEPAPETRAVSMRSMPAEIAGAIVKVMRGVKQLGFDERNAHGGYNYASIDKFLAAVRPLCADAGLVILMEEDSVEVKAAPAREGREEKAIGYLFPVYEIWLVHETGVMWGPLHRRLALPATGPQAFGSAESYVLKRFMRNLFQIPTGEKDADELPTGEIPSSSPQRTHTRQQAAPEKPGKDEAIRQFKAVRETIRTAGSVAEIEGVLRSGAYIDMAQMVREVEGPKADVVLNQLETLAAQVRARLEAQPESPYPGDPT